MIDPISADRSSLNHLKRQKAHHLCVNYQKCRECAEKGEPIEKDPCKKFKNKHWFEVSIGGGGFM